MPDTPVLVGRLTQPDKSLSITFDGRMIPALAGQSIAAALAAAGVRTFTRSFKYHRPRGLFCVSGECPNCLMNVNGRPNVRTCIEPARQGQVITHQNAWPALGFDALRIIDKLDRFLPVGFYYKRFHKPRWLWPVFEHVVRHIAGLGRIDIHATEAREADVEHVQTEICVVGAGPAGMAAALEAAEAGARVLLLEREAIPGGHLLYDSDFVPAEGGRILNHPRIRALMGTTVFGLYEENLLGAFQEYRLLKIRAKQVIVCTGGRQQPFLFQNNDLPGIFLARGVLRLAYLYGVRAGSRAVVLTDNDEGHRLARHLPKIGIEVQAVVDQRSSTEGQLVGPHVHFSSTIAGARGNSHLKAVQVAGLDAGGFVNLQSAQEIPCDLVCLASGLQPANELLLQAGMRFRYTGDRWQQEQAVAGLWAAGAAAGTFERDGQLLEGKLRGAEAAKALGYDSPALEEYRQQWADRDSNSPGNDCPVPQGLAQERKRFVCLCEDVTEKDLHQAVAEGFDHIETLKRYATVNMGPCQGKVCGQTAVAICARLVGRQIGAVGMTTSRPPVAPVELGVLAAEQHHHPERRTPIHHWHDSHGARWIDAGLWKRPEHYGDHVAEVQAVRSNVGLIDASTLGKLDVTGPDAGELLERIYLNRWTDLKVGRVRYGAMCNEDGILLDDGVGARMGPDHFYLTATTGNAEVVYQWLLQWKVTWQLKVKIVNQTSAVAALNLAGPRSREVLTRLAEFDVSNGAFPYLAMREGNLAGVPCRLMRLGFVGELGYEIHCPSAYALYVWEALLEAGKECGLKSFGVEAQRILRLEKGHVIIGQDTDALSNPFEAGFAWLVRLEKPLFIGREPLLKFKKMGARSRLIGFVMAENRQVLPEGSQVVEQGRPVGRLTSTRHSPTLQKSLGLAWLPAANASLGNHFFVRCNGMDVPAIITATPFYDPLGTRLRS
jgi:sarcosine oxidase subunit alpha